MATLILLNKTELPKGTPSEALVAVWDKGSVPDGQISIPVELNERLLPIRDDLAAWTYETGCARINGKLLEEHLRADDNLSMWWCSTLVEKHPKVTHNLFPALKLRALELLLDEKGVTRLDGECEAQRRRPQLKRCRQPYPCRRRPRRRRQQRQDSH